MLRVMAEPVNGVVDLAGPEKIGMDVFVRQSLKAAGDNREVVTDNEAGYFGGQVDDTALVPSYDSKARIAPNRLADWLARSYLQYLGYIWNIMKQAAK